MKKNKNKERIQKFNEIGDSRYIYQDELDKACFQHISWRMEILKISSEEQLLIKYCLIKHLILLKIRNMMNINVDLLQWSINFLIKETLGGTVETENISNKELAKELHKSIIRKFQKRKVHSYFKDNIWGAELADMQLISKFN